MSSYKVRIKGPDGTVWLEASPTLGEQRSASYSNYNIVHLPTEIYAYTNTGGRKFSIGAKLVSRNAGEANVNAGYLILLRKWLLPNFGGGPGIAGSTPPILRLFAYNNRNIQNVPVILKSYSWSFPDDIDYITDSIEPMPVIGSITFELDEAYSPDQISNGEWVIQGESAGRYIDYGGINEDDAVEIENDKNENLRIAANLLNTKINNASKSAIQVNDVTKAGDTTATVFNDKYKNSSKENIKAIDNLDKTFNGMYKKLSTDDFDRGTDKPIQSFENGNAL